MFRAFALSRNWVSRRSSSPRAVHAKRLVARSSRSAHLAPASISTRPVHASLAAERPDARLVAGRDGERRAFLGRGIPAKLVQRGHGLAPSADARHPRARQRRRDANAITAGAGQFPFVVGSWFGPRGERWADRWTFRRGPRGVWPLPRAEFTQRWNRQVLPARAMRPTTGHALRDGKRCATGAEQFEGHARCPDVAVGPGNCETFIVSVFGDATSRWGGLRGLRNLIDVCPRRFNSLTLPLPQREKVNGAAQNPL